MNGVALILGAINFDSYNTRVVLAGASLLGLAAGVIGTFLLLRRKALIGDVVGHCAQSGAHRLGTRRAADDDRIDAGTVPLHRLG